MHHCPPLLLGCAQLDDTATNGFGFACLLEDAVHSVELYLFRAFCHYGEVVDKYTLDIGRLGPKAGHGDVLAGVLILPLIGKIGVDDKLSYLEDSICLVCFIF